MYYYHLSLLGSPLEPLTFSSSALFSPLDIVTVPFQKKEKEALVLEQVFKPTFDTVEIVSGTDFILNQKQFDFASFISQYYFSSLGDALSLFIPYKKDVFIETTEKIVSDISLSSRQEKALVQMQKNKVSLLFGDTGSGKTEIYMKWFDEVLVDKKRVLMLMPEISLSPQMQIRLEEHFGDSVVMWHSKLTKKQKEKNLEKIHNGTARVLLCFCRYRT